MYVHILYRLTIDTAITVGTCTESKPLYPHPPTLSDRCCSPGHREQPPTELSLAPMGEKRTITSRKKVCNTPRVYSLGN